MILVSPNALATPRALNFAAVIHQWCKSCLHIWCGFPLSAPTLQHRLTNAALSLGEQVRLWHPEIFGCLRRPEDCSEWASDPALCVQNYRHAAVLSHPFLPGLLQTINPVVAGVCLSSWMISVSCPDGNAVIQACSWILCYTKSWNDNWSFQKQVQCKSRGHHGAFCIHAVPLPDCLSWVMMLFLPSPTMCSEKMAYSEHLNW